jgi:hypothetical protein
MNIEPTFCLGRPEVTMMVFLDPLLLSNMSKSGIVAAIDRTVGSGDSIRRSHERPSRLARTRFETESHTPTVNSI